MNEEVGEGDKIYLRIRRFYDFKTHPLSSESIKIRVGLLQSKHIYKVFYKLKIFPAAGSCF